MIDSNDQYERAIGKHLAHVNAQNFEYSVNVSLKHRYVYVETPKVGCSSIKKTLHRMELDFPELDPDDPDEIHDRGRSPLLKPRQTRDFDRILNDPGMFVFCFVRNPYSRLLSAYLDKIRGDRKPKGNVLAALGEDPSDLGRQVSFAQFVDVVCGQAVREMNPHWRVQYHQTFQDTIEYDFIGRLEDFTADSRHAFSRIRPDYERFVRSEARHATGSSEKLGAFYTDALRTRVFEKFRADFEAFGYPEAI